MDKPTLLMDIGNVLLRVELSRMETTLAAAGIAPTVAQMKLLHAIAEQHERGVLDTNAFLDRAASLLGHGETLRPLMLNAWNSIFPPDAPIAETWRACREQKSRGARIILFSNTNETHVAFMRNRWPEIFEFADAAVYSCETGALKPEARFYAEAIAELNLAPETTWYFDDKPENVREGLRHGLRARVFDWRRPEETLLPFLNVNY